MKKTQSFTVTDKFDADAGGKVSISATVSGPKGTPLGHIEEALTDVCNWAAEKGQMKLDFNSAVAVHGVTIRADKPLATRKTYSVTLEIPVGGTDGFTQQNTLHALSTSKKVLTVKMIDEPKPDKPGKAKKVTKTTPAAGQPGEDQGSPAAKTPSTTKPKKPPKKEGAAKK